MRTSADQSRLLDESTKSADYYYYSPVHSSKWVSDRMQRIGTREAYGPLPLHVAYLTPFIKTVLLAIIEQDFELPFLVTRGDRAHRLTPPANTLGIFNFNG